MTVTIWINDYEAHDILLCIQTGKLLHDPDRLHYGSNQLYFKSLKEMKELFPDIPEAYNNTLKIAEMIDLNCNMTNFYCLILKHSLNSNLWVNI